MQRHFCRVLGFLLFVGQCAHGGGMMYQADYNGASNGLWNDNSFWSYTPSTPPPPAGGPNNSGTNSFMVNINSGSVNLNISPTITSFMQSSGTVNTASGAQNLTTNDFTWTGGAQIGSGSIAINGAATLGTGTGPSTLRPANKIISLNNQYVFKSAFVLSGGNTTINLAGTGTITGDTSFDTFGVNNRINNTGTLIISNPSPDAGMFLPFLNSGTVFLQNGQFKIGTFANQDQTGFFSTGAEATLQLTPFGGTVTFSNSATFSGNGTIDFNALSPGTVYVVGEGFQPAGVTKLSRGNLIRAIETVSSNGVILLGNGNMVLSDTPGRGALFTPSIATTGGTFSGAVDVKDNIVVINYTGISPINDISALITSGSNAGVHNGRGIRSSSLVGQTDSAIGYGEASETAVTTINGMPLDSTSIIIMPTLRGDSNLNGTVEIGDFAKLAANFNQAGMWTDGDFTGDMMVSISDFAAMASNFNRSFEDLPRTAIPEPAMGGLLMVALRWIPRNRKQARG